MDLHFFGFGYFGYSTDSVQILLDPLTPPIVNPIVNPLVSHHTLDFLNLLHPITHPPTDDLSLPLPSDHAHPPPLPPPPPPSLLRLSPLNPSPMARILHEQTLYYTPEYPDCSIFRCISFPPLLPPPPPPPSPPPPPLSSPHKNGLANHALLASTALVAFFLVSILSSAFFLFFRRRRRRAAAQGIQQTPSFPSDAGLGPSDDPVHHVWYIRTVGLDEATIESIAVSEYRTGLVGAADCAVCLGDFADGDLVRLLPKCGHAFHVPCIDTWLRAHVNCPLCRAHVIDPLVSTSAVGTGTAGESIPEGENSETGSESSERSTREVGSDLQWRNEEGNEHAQEVFVEIPLSDSASDGENSSEVLVRTEERESRPVRYRSASVDSPFMSSNVVVTIPEIGTGTGCEMGKEESNCEIMTEKVLTQTGQSEMERSLSSSSSSRVFFFSRNGRSRSSVLPL
ncbi:hypothetical protein LUZ60_002658 [Juncus effusus]|nr:hypothetical protein LUZ60_002658 [Juncus effusus]